MGLIDRRAELQPGNGVDAVLPRIRAQRENSFARDGAAHRATANE